MIISGCCKNFYNLVTNLNNRDIKCSASKVIYKNFLWLTIIKSICKCSRRRFINYTQNIKSCYSSRILCGLSLSIIKICRNSYNSICNLFSCKLFCIIFQFSQNHRRNFLRRILLTVNLFSVICSHMSFYGKNSSVCISCRLSFSNIAHKP